MNEFPSCWYHKQVSVIVAAVFYARHYCPSCQRMDIIEICADCAKSYQSWIDIQGNYPWSCEDCGKTMERRVVGRINE